MEHCLFCKVVRRGIPAEIVLENDHALAFKDIRPVAPTHVLVIPKEHIGGVAEAEAHQAAVLGETLLLAKEVAKKMGVEESGYRVVINSGADAGQSVFHLHIHVLGGRALSWPPG
jgi:histidine triad (HIT) family protein